MFKKSMKKNLQIMIYSHRRESEGWGRKYWESCPFDQCCRICSKLFPNWDKWITRNNLDPTENHPCGYLTPEYVRRRVKEVILDE